MSYSRLIIASTACLLSFASLTAQNPAAKPSQPTQKTGTAPKPKIVRPALQAKTILHYGPVRLHKPLMVDSVNINNQPFNPKPITSSMPLALPQSKNYRPLTADEQACFRLSVDSLKDQKYLESYYYSLYVRSASYYKGKFAIECNAPWELFLDGHKIGSGRPAKAVADSIAPAWSATTLRPGAHTLTLKVQGLAPDQHKRGLDLRVGFTPDKADADISLSTSPEQYADLNMMIYGETLSSVSLSPSGKYAILNQRGFASGKPRAKYYLYRGTKRLSEISAPLAHARWMPKQDKLYYDEKTNDGRTLYAYDIETAQVEVLAPNIPKGNYSMLADEKTLIYYPTEEGPQYKKTLDRFSSADERIRGYRSRSFLATFDMETGVYQPLTFGARSTHLHSVTSASDKLIYSVATPTPTEVPFSRTDYYELNIKTQAVDTLFADTRGISQVMYTARPEYLLVVGSAEAFGRIGCVLAPDAPVNTYDNQLFLYNRQTKTASPLTKDFDPSVSRISVSDSKFEAYLLAENGDRKTLYRLDLATAKTVRLSNKEDYVKSFALSANGTTLRYIGQSALNADRLYAVDARSGKEQLIYDFSAEKLQHVDVGTMRDWDWTAPDGTKVQGRYYLPPHFDPKKKYPMLVYYYGGTSPVNRMLEGSYSLAMYASLGYVVYSLNPSGSTGYGQEFASRHINAWGDRTASEIIGAVKDFCKAHDFVNSQRVGCFGASYGGFMTQYLQTQTDIFAAAISHAGISALSSYWGEGYWGVGYSTVASKDSYPWNNAKLYAEHSPLFRADKIHTPLLLIHGLADTNVPVGESWQMFNALRILGRPVEFVGVYGEDHAIADPSKRYEWTSAMMAFFAKYLQDDPTWWNDLFPKGTH